MNGAQAQADYAERQFDLGHEKRALVIYQDLLKKNSGIFDQDALHLWKYAESHLGQGNLTLARGYYESLRDKFPAHPLKEFSRLRIADIAAIRLANSGNTEGLEKLSTKVPALEDLQPGELQAAVAIRMAYWTNPKESSTSDALLADDQPDTVDRP